MLPLELRSIAVNHAWNELTRQWRLPFAILAGSDPSLPPRGCPPPRPLFKNLPSRRYNHAFAKRAPFFTRQDPNIYPDSLHDTLEAHRDANRASLIHKSFKGNGNQPHNGIVQPGSDPNVEDEGRDDVEDADEEILDASENGSRRKRNARRNSPKQFMPDYEGHNQQPSKEWLVPTWEAPNVVRKPWLAYLDKLTTDDVPVHENLTAEILAFDSYMEPTASEKAAAGEAFTDVRKAIASLNPALKVSVVGSRSTGLAMPLSDIDVNLQLPIPLRSEEPGQQGLAQPSFKARVQTIDLLRGLRRVLRKRGGPKKMFYQPVMIDAKVPIVHAIHARTRLEIQIQSTTDSFSSMELVKAYMNEYPTLRPLFRVLRHMLKMRGLAEPRTCGVGSYPLIMMIVATLKFSGARFDRRDAARQLLYFLDFYSTIDFQSFGVAVDPPELFTKLATPSSGPQSVMTADEGDGLLTGELTPDQANNKSSLDVPHGRARISAIRPDQPYLMCLEDPVNPGNDLGSNSLAIKHCQATFANLRQRIKISMEIFKPGLGGSRRRSLLDPCLAGNYSDFDAKRLALQSGGEMMGVKPQVAKYL